LDFKEFQSTGRGQNLDNALSKLDKVCKKFSDFLIRGNVIIPEFEAECHVRYHAHLRAVKVGMLDAYNFCAIFESASWNVGDNFTRGSILQEVDPLVGIDGTANEVEDLVFIPIPQFVQDIHGRRGATTIKRLQTLDDCGRRTIDAMDLRKSVFYVAPLVVEDGEAAPISVGDGNHSPHGMIESRSYLAYDFTGDDTVSEGNILGHSIDDDMLIGLTVRVGGEVIVSARVGSQLRPKLFEVIIGPVKLGINTLQVIGHEGFAASSRFGGV